MEMMGLTKKVERYRGYAPDCEDRMIRPWISPLSCLKGISDSLLTKAELKDSDEPPIRIFTRFGGFGHTHQNDGK